MFDGHRTSVCSTHMLGVFCASLNVLHWTLCWLSFLSSFFHMLIAIWFSSVRMVRIIIFFIATNEAICSIIFIKSEFYLWKWEKWFFFAFFVHISDESTAYCIYSASSILFFSMCILKQINKLKYIVCEIHRNNKRSNSSFWIRPNICSNIYWIDCC